MKSFSRALRLAFRRKWAIAGILATSLLIALLWGANIGTVYPMVQVVFEGDSLQEYAEKELTRADEEIADLNAQISELQKGAKAEGADQVAFAAEISAREGRRKIVAESVHLLRKLKPYVDQYAPATPFKTLVAIITVLIVCTLIKLFTLMTNIMLVQYVAQRSAIDLRAIFYRKTLKLDLDSFGENGSSDLTARLTNDIGLVSAGITVILGRLVREPLKMIVCVGSAAYVCPRLLLLVLIVTPLVALSIHHLSRAIRRASRRAMEEMSQLYGLLNNSYAGIRVIKAFNTQAHERAKFNKGTVAYFRKSMKMAFYNTLARSTTELLGITTVGLAILAGGYLVLNQQTHLFGIRMSEDPLTFAQVLAFFAFLIGANDPARKLTDVWSGLQRGIAATTRVYEIIDKPIRVGEPKVARTTQRPHKAIQFKDVTYQYPQGPVVLKELNLEIPHGETVVVVGPNGSGKSTLISLLCRFDDPQSGEVCLDDVPINEMRTRDLRKRISLVTQRTILFDETIENNIRYGSPSADSHAVVRAAKMAFADEFIRQKTPNGYQTILGTNGMRLSGGQMQRIALARAFLRNPDILVLDEATSQIDLESEQLIHVALTKFLVDRTGIMITHRPSSLSMADRIVVVESGKIADSGQHADLIQRNSFYQSLAGDLGRHAA